jgi:uncharacterized coiled-coil protein SlyX
MSGTFPDWSGRAAVLALGVGAALLLPRSSFAQAPADATAQRELLERDLKRELLLQPWQQSQVESLQAQIHALTHKLQDAEVVVQRGAGDGRDQPARPRVVRDQVIEEIILRKVDGKWEVVVPRSVRTAEPAKSGWEAVPGIVRPRIAVGPDTSGAERRPVILNPIEIRARRSPTTDRDARLDELEKKIDKVLQQLEQMRRQMAPSRRGAALPTDDGPDNVILPLRVILDVPPDR